MVLVRVVIQPHLELELEMEKDLGLVQEDLVQEMEKDLVLTQLEQEIIVTQVLALKVVVMLQAFLTTELPVINTESWN
jgi:hypothetical protein|tara:strand:- start:258 stop:491 length:234 start_codon:yes stop_codon:yes gene_type:complete